MDITNKRYLTTSSGISKKDGNPYAIAQAIIKTQNGEFLSDSDKFFLKEVRPIGEIVEVAQTIVTPSI